MEKLFPKTIEPVYETEKEMLVLSDTFEALKKIKKESVDMIFADPP